MGSKGLNAAIKTRPADIKALQAEHLKSIEAPGINIFKRVEMNMKHRPVLPIEDQDDVLYEDPTPEVFAAVKEEKAKRGAFKKTLNAEIQE